LYSLAVKHYKRVLEMAEKDVGNQNGTFSLEAAYNLSLICVTTGAAPLAQALYRKLLSL
ncbi:hypothetical protein MPER_04213, partial [Moniliophthora perniciosa FA553]